MVNLKAGRTLHSKRIRDLTAPSEHSHLHLFQSFSFNGCCTLDRLEHIRAAICFPNHFFADVFISCCSTGRLHLQPWSSRAGRGWPSTASSRHQILRCYEKLCTPSHKDTKGNLGTRVRLTSVPCISTRTALKRETAFVERSLSQWSI